MKRFADSIAKIERSKTHLSSLKDEILAFWATSPFQVRALREPQTQRLIYTLVKADEVPPTISVTTGEVIQLLRSALDLIAYELFIENSGDPNASRHLYFPIADDFAKYESNKAKLTAGLSASDLQIIDSLQPYKGGNNVLWQMQRLSNIDKHRKLIVAGASYKSFDVGAHITEHFKRAFPNRIAPEISMFLKPANIQFPLSVGTALFVDGPGAKEIPNMDFKLGIVLNEPNIVECEKVTDVLDRMVATVEYVLHRWQS